MSLDALFATGPERPNDRKPISVPLPNAYAGIASALKASYAALPIDEQLNKLLARLK